MLWHFALIFSFLTVGESFAQTVSEYDLKAVFLLNLAYFVEWPEERPMASDQFIIGIYGPDPFGERLETIIAGEQKNNKPIVVKRFRSFVEIEEHDCMLLFISKDAMDSWQQVYPKLSGRAILTVADADGFAHNGGMVNLVKKKQQIELEINHYEVKKSGLLMSSKLLRLAQIVKE